MGMADSTRGRVDLSLYQNPPDLDKGASFLKRALWHVVNAAILQNPANPSSKLKKIALKAFGAKIGVGVLIKPGVNIKSPWHLEIGDHSWIGERAWIDSLAPVKIGANVCISQDVYLCCGNHDWTDRAFGKAVRSIVVEDGAWIATRATVMGGVTIGSHAVIAAGAVLSKSAEPYGIYVGVPAQLVKERVIRA